MKIETVHKILEGAKAITECVRAASENGRGSLREEDLLDIIHANQIILDAVEEDLERGIPRRILDAWMLKI